MTPGAAGIEARLRVLPGAPELARAAAGAIWSAARERAAAARRAGKGAGRFAVALSGGETPRQALSTLAAPPYRDGFPWDTVDVFQVDERLVPPADARSNQGMIRESLLARAPFPAGRFHPVDVSLADPAAAARAYAGVLEAFFGRRRLPRFDLVLLGLGADGHTASLFPGSRALEEREAWVTAAEGGDPPLPRVTLTLPVINAAARALFLVSGAAKAGALAAVLAAWREGSRGPLPAARVVPERGTLLVLADADATRQAPAGGGGDAPGRVGAR